MRERGDLDVLHEPFMYDYYMREGTRPFDNFDPASAHPSGYADIRDMILGRAEQRPVFLKDMAYYVQDRLPDDPAFASRMTHAFLVRDPAESILSYHRKDQGFSCKEVGIEAQWRLFAALRDMGHDPVVIRSADLRADPAAVMARYWRAVGLAPRPGALTWNPALPDAWKPVEAWHSEVLDSTTIIPAEPRDARAELAVLGPPFTDYDAHHRPYFELLCNQADHQK